MLNSNDIALLKGVFSEMLRENNKVFGADLKRNIRDEVHALIQASEHRLMKRMDKKFGEFRTLIVNDIGEILDNSVLPQITELQMKIA